MSNIVDNMYVLSDRSLTANKFTGALQSATAIPGMIKNAEGKIGEKITYARITIRKRNGTAQ